MKQAIIGILAAALAGCVTPATLYEFENSNSFSHGGDVVWPAIIEVFAENHINIQTLERDSGIVGGEYRVAADEQATMYSCARSAFLAPVIDTLRYNVFMREGPNGTTVSINLQVERQYRDSLNGGTQTAVCNSTGDIERTLLDRIGTKIQST